MISKNILFACVPADGHFNPLIGLALSLKSNGNDVRWYAQDYYKNKIENFGFHHYPFITPPQLNQSNLDTCFPARKKIKGKVNKIKFDLVNGFVKRSEEYLEDIEMIHKTFPFDLIIADVMFTALPLVKQKFKVPVIAVGVIPVSETSKGLPPMGMGMLPSKNVFGKTLHFILRKVITPIIFKDANRVFRDILKKYQIVFKGDTIFDMIYKSSSLVLQNGIPGFEYSRPELGRNIRFIGELAQPGSLKLSKFWLPGCFFSYKKKILITQGTVEKDITKLLVPCLEAFRNSEVLVIATTGGAETETLRLKYNAQNFFIDDYIPFDEIMPLCDVFITNGGYGGVLQSIRHQLPMVVAGLHEGKNEINARVEHFHIGINLHTENPRPAQILKAVEKVLNSGTYHAKIKELSAELKSYDSLKLSEAYISKLLE